MYRRIVRGWGGSCELNTRTTPVRTFLQSCRHADAYNFNRTNTRTRPLNCKQNNILTVFVFGLFVSLSPGLQARNRTSAWCAARRSANRPTWSRTCASTRATNRSRAGCATKRSSGRWTYAGTARASTPGRRPNSITSPARRPRWPTGRPRPAPQQPAGQPGAAAAAVSRPSSATSPSPEATASGRRDDGTPRTASAAARRPPSTAASRTVLVVLSSPRVTP